MRRLFLVFMCFWGIASAGSLPVVVVPAKQGVFEVALPANPTTGFQWVLVSYDKKILKSLGQKYRGGLPRRVGSGGKTFFYFQCRSVKTLPAHTSLTFAYRRPWEPQAGKETTVNVVFEH